MEFSGMQSTTSLPLVPGLQWPGMVAPDMIRSIDLIEPFDIETVYLCQTELFEIELFDYLTVCKQIELLVRHRNTWNYLIFFYFC